MKQFTIYTTEGIFIHVLAEAIERRIEAVLFYVGGRIIDRYPSSHVITVHTRAGLVPVPVVQECRHYLGCD